jgi:predicted amidohydrolase YtcJ
MASTVIRQARLVSVGSPAPTGEPVDIRIKDGVVVAVATGLRPEGDEQVIDAAGRWAIPGLWDQHVHMVQWAKRLVRLDVSGTSSPSEVARIVGKHVTRLPESARGTVVSGYGYRSAGWSRQPNHPVVLISG